MRGFGIRTVAAALAGVSLTGLATPFVSEAHAQANARRTFNIPAQPMANALETFGRQSGRDIMFDRGQVAGLRSNAVRGSLEPGEALRRLVGGSGLSISSPNGATFVVGRGPGESQAGSAAADSESANSEIVVTGTNIRGAAPIGSPIQVYTREDIDRSGAQTPAQFVETLTQNFSGGITLQSGGNEGIGQIVQGVQSNSFNDIGSLSGDYARGSSVNLRGLGQGTTLILVNGRRLASAAAQSGGRPYVDISSIPLSAVERIEVLTDGASAIYGADAVGGVINFILRSDYVGAETRLSAGVSTAGDAAEYRFAQNAGFGWGTGNAILSYEYYRRDNTVVENRPTIDSIGGGVGILSGDILPLENSHSIAVSLNQNMTDSARLFLDLSFNHRKTRTSSSYFLDYETRFPGFGFGTRSTTSRGSGKNVRYSGAFGVDWNISPSWNGRFTVALARDNFSYDSEALVVEPVFGTNTNFGYGQENSSELVTLDAAVSGALFSLPAGAVRLAAGVQHRSDTFDYRDANTDRDNTTGTTSSSRTIQNPASVQTRSVFAELEVPVLSSVGDASLPLLTISAAGRYENYSNFGSTFDPKIGVRIVPVRGLILRGSYSTSFRPPSVQQLRPPQLYYSNYRPDPRQPDGLLHTLEVLDGGNPHLQPETSSNWSAGLDYSSPRFANLRISVSYFDIRYRNRILTIPGGVTSAGTVAQFGDPAYERVRILRGSIPDAEFDALVAEILANRDGVDFLGCNQPPGAPFSPSTRTPCNEPVSQFEAIRIGNLQNVARSRDRGLDISLSQFIDTGIGRLSWDLSATYIIDHKQQFTPTAPLIERVDQLFFPVDLNARARLGWSRGGWAVDTTVDYTDSYRNVLFTPARKISSYTTVDLNVRYDSGDHGRGVLRNVLLMLHVDNLLRQHPPRIQLPAGDSSLPFDPTNSDFNLRRVTFTMTKRW